MTERILGAAKRQEDELERSLRPAGACRFRRAGSGARKSFGFHRGGAGPLAKLSIMCCLPGRPVWEKRRWRRSSRANLVSTSARHRGR